MKRSLSLFASLLIVGLVWVTSVQAGAGMAVSPSRFRLQKAAGEAASGKVRIKNTGTYPIRISTEMTDMILRTDRRGFSIRDEAPMGTMPHSCARWIHLVTEDGSIIGPGESALLEFVVSPPREINSGGYGAYLFFIGHPAQAVDFQEPDTPQIRVVTVPRLGVSVVYEVEGTLERRGELVDLQFSPPNLIDPIKIQHTFRNTGNAEVLLTGFFHIMDSQERLIGKGTLKTLKTFPGDEGTSETIWQEMLLPGHYTILITLELGPDPEEVIVRELGFDVQ